MDPALQIITAICLLAAASAASVGLLRLNRRIEDEEAKMGSKRSAFSTEDYHADGACDICFDSIGDEPVSQCRCGKTFHLSCAEPTGECPYCGTPFSEFIPPRPARHVTCPRCGNPVEGNICSCGTVIPDGDGTFLCGCGERLSVSESICHRCGRMYESRVVNVDKRFIPHSR